jgi:cellulose synthase/poly-beta-1,6-N-acetylglucosamine synthase-like glycosyltransferase
MNTALTTIAFLLLLPFAASALYLGGLACLALLPRRRRSTTSCDLRRFAFVVPAHNEERALPELLASIRGIDYPPHLYSVTVVADNCDDATVRIARQAGVLTVERRDTTFIGKGYALALGLARISAPYDAVVFVDGDCTVSPNILRAFNAGLESGEQVMQAHYTMRSAGNAATGVLRELGLCLVHVVRPAARERFGGSAGLKGSGMCFSRAAIGIAGWDASGLAEDIEQHVRVLHAGMRVSLTPEALVVGEAPETLTNARSQHARWEAGRLSAARGQALALLSAGVRRRSIACIDAAIDLLVPPISVVTVALVALLPVALLLESPALIALDAAALVAMVLYVGCGLVLLRARPGAVLRAGLAVPRYVLWKATVYAQAAVFRPRGWERSHRDATEPAAPPGS